MANYYDTLEEAVQAATAAAVGISPHYETGGILFQGKDGKFFFSEPATEGKKKDDGFRIRVKVPPGATPVGIFHNHPVRNRQADMFSPEDVQMADQLGVPSFIINSKTGQIRRFHPKEDERATNGRFKGSASGNLMTFEEKVQQAQAQEIHDQRQILQARQLASAAKGQP